jgi:NAD(P)-dependent dehydrogenase (short-subunit alcohol dehydrogenase family)
MTSTNPDRQQLQREPLPLRSRVALVTGVSRRAGIGYAISRRWGTPDDPARLIAWLATDEASWITRQIINTECGFRRYD